jgi:hypothetical protein
MKRMMSISAIALFLAGASALACDSCGCEAKKGEGKKKACSMQEKKECCTQQKKSCSKQEKKCSSCTEEKACSAKKEKA